VGHQLHPTPASSDRAIEDTAQPCQLQVHRCPRRVPPDQTSFVDVDLVLPFEVLRPADLMHPLRHVLDSRRVLGDAVPLVVVPNLCRLVFVKHGSPPFVVAATAAVCHGRVAHAACLLILIPVSSPPL
jgi:hypothetical protein